MKLDLPTLAFVVALTCLAQVAALVVQVRINQAYRGIGWWLTGSIAFAAGFVFHEVHAVVGWRLFGMFANPALIFAHMALMVGTFRFLDRQERRAWAVAALAAAVTLYYVFLFAIPAISARTTVVAAAIGLFDLATARALLAHRDRRFTQSVRFTAGIFLAHSCFLLVLAGTTLARAQIRTYHDYSFFQTLAFVVPAIASTLWTSGFILMLNQRLGAERLESLAEWRRAEREKAELALRNQRLEKAESLARMAGAIAHHYNNQMQVVLGALELLEADLPKAEAGGNLAHAIRSTERAADMSRLMLVYLGQGSRNQDLHDLASLCRTHLPSIRAKLPDRIRFQADLPARGPSIRADANQIHLALGNLADNAREALEETGGELRIGVGIGPAEAIPSGNRFPAGWQPQAADHAWVEVADSGAGIAPAAMDVLCDPFYSTKFTGRGLGLSVVLGIAQAHGGGLTVESRPGMGSAFRIHIPVAGSEAPCLQVN